MPATEEREWWRAAVEAAAQLQADRGGWAGYVAEADEWDTVAGDGLPDPADEWPEYNRVRGRRSCRRGNGYPCPYPGPFA